MMQFTQIPENHAPLGGRLLYVFESDQAGEVADHLFRVCDEESGAMLAARRFARCGGGKADVAPMLRPQVHFTPSAGGTGFFEDGGRTLRVRVRVDEGTETGADAGVRCFLPVTDAAGEGTVPCGLRTTMPLCRMIAPDEADELTLFAEEPVEVAVTAHLSGGVTRSSRYASGQAGWQLFRLDMDDFSDAERVTVDAGELGRITYVVAPAPHGSRRLAWRSPAGSVEHYTFPFETVVSKQTVKERVYGASGHEVTRVVSERLVTLRSAFERREVMEALAGIVSSPEVWLLCGGSHMPVDVVTSEVEINRHGTYDALEIAIRPTLREQVL